MIIDRSREVAGVRYDMVFEGKVIDIVKGGDVGLIRDMMAAVARNPGMEIVATVYEIPKKDRVPEVIVSRRKVYPVD